MFDYLKDVIVVAAEDLKNSCLYFRGNDQPFKVDYDSPSLPPKDAELFHCHVTRLLFTSKKALQGKIFHIYYKTLIGLNGINKHTFYEKYKEFKNQSV